MAEGGPSNLNGGEAKVASNEGGLLKTLDAFESELQCSICTELFVKAVTLNCSHSFCKFCINQWMKSQSKCPICRKKITNTLPTLVLDTYIEKVLDGSTPDIKQKRLELINQRDKDMAALEESRAENRPTGRNIRLNVFVQDFGSSDFDDSEDEDDNDFWDDEWDDIDSSGISNDEYDQYSGLPEEDEEVDLSLDNLSVLESDSCSEEDENDNEEGVEENLPATTQTYTGIPGAFYGGSGHCYHCGEVGHWANGCPQRNDLFCYTCNKTGHFSNACPIRNIHCYKCGQSGHRAALCNN